MVVSTQEIGTTTSELEIPKELPIVKKTLKILVDILMKIRKRKFKKRYLVYDDDRFS